MKKSFVLIFVLICAALSVLSVSAAPRDRYYDQLGNKHWCNSDSYGCWVTGENGEHEYIMFWSESARDAIMGSGSKAPIGTNPGTSELTLAAPKPVSAAILAECDWPPETCKCSEERVKECESKGKSCYHEIKWSTNPDGTSDCYCDVGCR